MSKPRVLLIGWDAADWKVIQPLLDAGQMPNLARLIAGGVYGNLATIYPALSPMLWTSIATGKRAYKHGIHGFSEPLPDGSGVRPITLLSRKTKAVWNILNQSGHRSMVVGWWPSHPAEPLNGAMVSNYFPQIAGDADAPAPLPPGTVHPTDLRDSLAELRVHPMELTGEFIRLFVPDYQKVDQDKDKRLHALGKVIAETMSIHAAGTELLAREPWDFAAIYYSGIDHFGHGFMRFHPPRLPSVSEEDFAIYKDVVSNAYKYHDAMLGTLLGFTDENTTVILMSDHGFHPDHLRPGYIPAEPAGPAVEHRYFGILCMKGPGIRINERLFGAGILDVCPTILGLFGLPAGKDMDGKVLVTAFNKPFALEPIDSWDAVPGQDGTHPPETRLDPVASSQAFKQLVELGYVAPPGPNAQETVDECVRELKYNLARAYRDGNRYDECAQLAEELWERWPREHRFGILLIESLATLREARRRRAAIDELAARVERYRVEAAAELGKREAERKAQPKPAERPDRDLQTREQYEERRLRELTFGRQQLLHWFRISQALLEKRPAEARRLLKELRQVEGLNPALLHHIAGALTQLGETEAARTLLDSALQFDPEDPFVHSQLAEIHLKAGRIEEAINTAAESLSLLYFQPAVHGILGKALMQAGRFLDAEQELRVAVAQSPRNLAAHELLGKMYRDHLNRPAEALAHEGRARSLRLELQAQRASGRSPVPGEAAVDHHHSAGFESFDAGQVPAPFPPGIDPGQVITIVSGLPRSGTSLMMQLLSAGGRQALTDGKRIADADNPLGYLEFEKTLQLPRDASWVPQARGKVLKVVAQLLPSLPKGEYYNVIFMRRDLTEVIASQNAMLARQGRQGADMNQAQLMETYTAQLKRVSKQLQQRPDVRLLTVDYAGLLTDPASGVARVAEFLGGTFNQSAAAEAIHPELHRQKLATATEKEVDERG